MTHVINNLLPGAGGGRAGGAGAGGAGVGGAGPVAPEITRCTYITFIKCDPQPFKGTEGAMGLCQWFEKLESVFRISDCKERDKVKFATATLQGRALTWWNGTIASMGIDAANGTPWTELKGTDIDGYTNRFHELALLCPRMVEPEQVKVEQYLPTHSLRFSFFFSVNLIASSLSKSSSTKGDVLEGGGVSSNVTLSDSSIFMQKGNLGKFSYKEQVNAIEDCAQYDKKCNIPTSVISNETIANLNAQIRFREYMVMVTSTRNTHRLVTYPEEVEKTLGTLIEVESYNKTKLEEVGLKYNHNTPFSSREVPSFDGPEPQPLLNSPSLDVSLGDVIGPEPPIKPHSPDSSRIKIVDYLTTQTPPSSLMANSHPKGEELSYSICPNKVREVRIARSNNTVKSIPVNNKFLNVIFDKKKLGSS
ncbi:hypothetical protein Tco_0775908 [Tanacetum coccineum]